MVTMHGDVIRVVVVDDHALHRDGTRQILEVHSDLQVVGEAASGEVALALVNQLRPDVVLMDIRLPGMNGIEVTRQLIQDHPDVRVLMVSAYDEDEYVRGALEAGAAGYLSKTAPGKELVQAVRAVRPDWSTLVPPATARTAWTSSLPGAVLLRYPAAPASSAPRTYSSSSYALTIRIRSSGWSRVSWRVSSMPFVPGSRMSISTTSGRSWFTRARATSPEGASPTTCRSECTSRIWRVPSRCNAWSSTTTTRITSVSMVTMVNRLRAVSPWTGGEHPWVMSGTTAGTRG